MGLLTDGERRNVPAPKTCQTYPTMMTFGIGIPYLQKVQKFMNQMTQPLSSADTIFTEKLENFGISRDPEKD